ncbi:hypothetical protein H0N99_05150 [Candidatus Micrarchaeota archaeon]|nr:hypothetical protein [Candidatus Micrarchaeota archaeon]
MECAYHPGEKAVAQCSKCGRPLCEECSKYPDRICIDCSISPKKVETAIRLINWGGWIGAFTEPDKEFKNSGELASFAGVVMNLLVGLVTAGILAFLLVILGKPPSEESAGSLTGVFVYTTQYIIFLLLWLITAMVSYSFAMLVGGMGSLKKHLYLLSLVIPLSPLVILILGGVLGFLYAIHLSVAFLGAIFVTVYIVNIFIKAVREAHRFGLLQASVSSTVSLITIAAAVGLLIFVFRR